MIIKIKLSASAQKEIESIKLHYFDAEDRITKGYIVGKCIDDFASANDKELLEIIKKYKQEPSLGKSKSTTLNIRADSAKKLEILKDRFEMLYKRKLYLSQVIDMILLAIMLRIQPNIINKQKQQISFDCWNINGRTGTTVYGIPTIPVSVIAKQILDKRDMMPDVLIFTEYYEAINGIKDLKDLLQGYYHLFSSPFSAERNGILIGVKLNSGLKVLNTNSHLTDESVNIIPDFLEVVVETLEKKQLSIIGTRIIQTNAADRKKQIKLLANYIKKIKHFILGGDLNNYRILGDKDNIHESYIKNTYPAGSVEYNYQIIKGICTEIDCEIYTPESPYNSDYAFDYTSIHKLHDIPLSSTNYTHKIDHFLCSPTIKCTSTDYDWSFLKNYPDSFFCGNDILPGIPDHALLKGMFELY